MLYACAALAANHFFITLRIRALSQNTDTSLNCTFCAEMHSVLFLIGYNTFPENIMLLNIYFYCSDRSDRCSDRYF